MNAPGPTEHSLQTFQDPIVQKADLACSTFGRMRDRGTRSVNLAAIDIIARIMRSVSVPDVANDDCGNCINYRQ